jgi:hypothetical protein
MWAAIGKSLLSSSCSVCAPVNLQKTIYWFQIGFVPPFIERGNVSFLKRITRGQTFQPCYRAFMFWVATAGNRDTHMRLTAASGQMYAPWTCVSCHHTSGHSMGIVVLFTYPRTMETCDRMDVPFSLWFLSGIKGHTHSPFAFCCEAKYWPALRRMWLLKV